jgi:hypothetical protein
MHTMFKPSGLARRRPAGGRSGADRQGGRGARADDRGDVLDDPRSPPREALRQYRDGRCAIRRERARTRDRGVRGAR